MTAGYEQAPADAGAQRESAIPELSFTVTGVAPAPLAVVPTLEFKVGIGRTGGGAIRSITLTTAIRIAAAKRRYTDEEKQLLVELFGQPQQWGSTMRALPWTRTHTVVPPFTDSTVVDVGVACSYDIELAVTKYFHAVRHGEVPLDFLFSGTVFYCDQDGGLRTAQIAWSSEATFRLPAGTWHELMDQCSPGHSWLRISSETFQRLYAYKARHALASWDATFEELLDRQGLPDGQDGGGQT